MNQSHLVSKVTVEKDNKAAWHHILARGVFTLHHKFSLWESEYQSPTLFECHQLILHFLFLELIRDICLFSDMENTLAVQR